MVTQITYTNDGVLERLIRERGLIPHKVLPGERYVRNEYYYDAYFGKVFRVIYAEYQHNGMLDGAYIKADDGNYAWITQKLDMYTDYYITKDEDFKLAKSDIIESGKPYTGAEIRYWFFMNNIKDGDKKYKNFWPYVEQYNAKAIDDKALYLIDGKLCDDGVYRKTKLTRVIKKKIITPKQRAEDEEYMDKLRKRELTRIKEKYNKIGHSK